MRHFIVSLGIVLFFAHTSSYAAMKLRYPLLEGRWDKKIVPLSDYNWPLVKTGAKIQFPDYVVLESKDQAVRALNEIEELIHEGEKILRRKLYLVRDDNLDIYTRRALLCPLCYEGEPASVMDLINQLTADTVAFNNNSDVQAWNYKGEKHLQNDSQPASEENYPDSWHRWEWENEDVLIAFWRRTKYGNWLETALLRKCDPKEY